MVKRIDVEFQSEGTTCSIFSRNTCLTVFLTFRLSFRLVFFHKENFLRAGLLQAHKSRGYVEFPQSTPTNLGADKPRTSITT